MTNRGHIAKISVDSHTEKGRFAGNACRSLWGKDVIEHERTQEDINDAGGE